jgi:hypothetical protein
VFLAIADAQDVTNKANAGTVCRPALPSYRDVVNANIAGAKSALQSPVFFVVILSIYTKIRILL